MREESRLSCTLTAAKQFPGAHRSSMMREAMERGSPPTGERVRNESSSSEKEPLHRVESRVGTDQ